MVAVKGYFENGQITFAEPLPEEARIGGRQEVTVYFEKLSSGEAEDGDAKWEAILNDPRPRPKLTNMGEEALRLMREGKTKPLNLDDL